MGGVRFVAAIFGIIGWITLAIGALAFVGLLLEVGKSPLGLVSSFGALVGALALALGPLFLWAVLKALIEIQDQVSRLRLETAARQQGAAKPGQAIPADPSPGGNNPAALSS